MTRRASLSALARPLLAIAGAVALTGLVYELSGFSSIAIVRGVWDGAIAAPGALTATLRWSTPLLLIGLGVLVAIRAGFFNVGAQGQFYVGATAAVAVALSWPDAPAVVAIPLAMVAGAVAGAVYSLAPGYLRVRFGTDEVISTLMANFVATLWLLYITAGPFQDRSGSGEVTASRVINPAFRISDSSGVSPVTIGLCLLAAVATWLLVRRSRFGILSGIAGRNPVMARWQGIDVGRIGLTAFALSGALAGLAGAVEVLGPGGRLVAGLAPEIGFTAVLVAIVGGLDVRGVATAALFFGGLQASLLYLPIVEPIPRSALDLLRGAIALLITVSALPLAWWWRRRTTGIAAALQEA